MTANTTFNAILNAPINVKKKNAEGKYDVIVTTALQDNFAHSPKPKDCADESAKSALNALDKVFDYMETASTARTDNQRDKAINKAYDYAREYLKAVGLSAGNGNVAMLTSVFAPKKQTVQGTIKGGYTTKATFVKYALYLTNHFIETGAWCDVKSSAGKSAKATTFEELERVYVVQFGFSPEVAKELVEKAKAAKAQF